MTQIEVMLGPVAGNVLAAAALTLTPVWMRPGTWFGVRVAREYRSSSEALRSRNRYRAAIWASAVPAAFLTVVACALGKLWLVPLGFVFQMVSATVAFRAAWRRTLPHRIESPTTRSAHLITEQQRIPGGLLAFLTPFLLLAGVSLDLLVNWNSIPNRFPIHWDLAGDANGWRDRTGWGVFGPVAIAFAILLLMTAVIAVQSRMARRAPAATALYRRNRAILAAVVIAMWGIAIMFSLVALTPLILVNGQFPVPAFVLVLIPVGVAAGAIWVVAHNSGGADDLPPDITPDECWTWGMFYHNRADSSILVERRFGAGYTLNFARWQSWLLLAGLVALPLAIVLIVGH